MTIAWESGPCSACDSRSQQTAVTSASSSAMTSTSDGPAGISLAAPPGRAAICCLASVTQALPGPNNLAQAGMLSVPSPIAAMACAPPTLNTRLIPQRDAAAKMAGATCPFLSGGVHRITCSQAAICAGIASMITVDISGAVPPGTYRPTGEMGKYLASQRKPGAVSMLMGAGLPAA